MEVSPGDYRMGQLFLLLDDCCASSFASFSSCLLAPKSIVLVSGVRGKDFGIITQLCDVFCRRAAWCQNFLFSDFFFFFSVLPPEILKESWVGKPELTLGVWQTPLGMLWKWCKRCIAKIRGSQRQPHTEGNEGSSASVAVMTGVAVSSPAWGKFCWPFSWTQISAASACWLGYSYVLSTLASCSWSPLLRIFSLSID